jgi:integrase
MASLRKFPRSPYWYACISLPDGRQRQFSTGTDDKAEAYALAVAAERALRKPAASSIRNALLRLADEYHPAVALPAGQWIRIWANGRRGTIAASSILAYNHIAEGFADWLDANGIDDLAAITPDVIVRWRNGLDKAASSKNTAVKIISVALATAAKAGHLPANPCTQVQRLRQAKPRRREFRAPELRILLDAVRGEWRVLTLAGLYTGQRLNDLAVLRWSNLDLDAGTILLHTAKTGRLIHLPLLPPVLEAILALPAGDTPDAHLLPGIAALAPSSRSNQFRRILVSCGLAVKRGTRSGATCRTPSELSFHSLRHSATTMLKAAGVSDAIARAIIGHESEAISRAYTHLDLETIRAAMAKISPP